MANDSLGGHLSTLAVLELGMAETVPLWSQTNAGVPFRTKRRQLVLQRMEAQPGLGDGSRSQAGVPKTECTIDEVASIYLLSFISDRLQMALPTLDVTNQ